MVAPEPERASVRTADDAGAISRSERGSGYLMTTQSPSAGILNGFVSMPAFAESIRREER